VVGPLGLAHDGFGADAEVDGWLKLDPLLFEGTAIDADIETGERQMYVWQANQPSRNALKSCVSPAHS
jgi:hypothetical protein